MQRLEVSGAVRLIYRSLGVKGLSTAFTASRYKPLMHISDPPHIETSCFTYARNFIIVWNPRGSLPCSKQLVNYFFPERNYPGFASLNPISLTL